MGNSFLGLLVQQIVTLVFVSRKRLFVVHCGRDNNNNKVYYRLSHDVVTSDVESRRFDCLQLVSFKR